MSILPLSTQSSGKGRRASPAHSGSLRKLVTGLCDFCGQSELPRVKLQRSQGYLLLMSAQLQWPMLSWEFV